MILVTVGMQLGFERLIRAVDRIQPDCGVDFVAQTGPTSYVPTNLVSKAQFGPAEFEELASRAALIVSHAGIGTVLLAKRLRKPIVLFPRKAGLGEHRNDHQLSTAAQLAGHRGIFVAMAETELRDAISLGLACGPIGHEISPTLGRLQSAVASFVASGTLR
ncbi:MAG: glucuronosyltransferase [Alphaproteobacteria bacterium]|nr:MAG: glucuronosyltransferase [Alphaproteobacteria bacterium]